MRMHVAVIGILFAGTAQAPPLAAQQMSAYPPISLDFSDFVPHEYTMVADVDTTRRTTVNYQVSVREGRQILERREVVELVEAAAIPRTIWRQTVHSRSTLPELLPLSTRIVEHQWNDTLAVWLTRRIDVEFLGDSVRRVVGTGKAYTRPIPPGVRQRELTSDLFVHFAGGQPPSTMNVRVYDAIAGNVSEIGWVVRGLETMTVLGDHVSAWAVTFSFDSSSIYYYVADRPHLFLGTRPVAEGAGLAPSRLVRLWCGRPANGLACGSWYRNSRMRPE